MQNGNSIYSGERFVLGDAVKREYNLVHELQESHKLWLKGAFKSERTLLFHNRE